MIPPPRARRRRHSRLHVWTRDDAGVEREVAAFSGGDAPDIADPIVRGELARLSSRAASRHARRTWPLTAGIVVLSLIIMTVPVFSVILGARWLRVGPLLMLLALVPTMACATFALIWIVSLLMTRMARGSCEFVCDALLRMRRCASCGYSLEPNASDEPGLVHCSECGAAWKRARVGGARVADAASGQAGMLRSVLWMCAGCRTHRMDDRGRPFARLPGDYRRRWAPKANAADSVMRWLTVATVLVPVAALVLAMFTLAWGDRSVPRNAVAILIVATGLTLTAIAARRIQQVTREQYLRRRICLACEQRLRSNDGMLVCERCDAAWRKPQPRRGRARKPIARVDRAVSPAESR